MHSDAELVVILLWSPPRSVNNISQLQRCCAVPPPIPPGRNLCTVRLTSETILSKARRPDLCFGPALPHCSAGASSDETGTEVAFCSILAWRSARTPQAEPAMSTFPSESNSCRCARPWRPPLSPCA